VTFIATVEASSSLQPQTRTTNLSGLLEDGIYLMFLLRSGNAPQSTNEFVKRIEAFLAEFDRQARALDKPPHAINDAKYAFCALVDEIILSSTFAIRDEWERAPLQLRLFGEHLAGERFFEKLDTLRSDPEKHIETLEVFHNCLLLGFQGKYLLDGPEKLSYLISRINQEIQHAHGGKAEFAPNWKPPQRFQQYVRNELPLWLFFALLCVVAAVVFTTYTWLLDSDVGQLTRLSLLGVMEHSPVNVGRVLT